jgi:hypothetical protein
MMPCCRYLPALLLAILPVLADAQGVTQVMVVGTFHMSNPGRDMHDVKADDVLAPRRQAEIAAIIAGLARFHPTVVDIEWPTDVVTQRYAAFLAGKLPPSRNESVQLGFRLAQASGAAIHGIDVDGDFPYDAVEAYAKAHHESDLLARADAVMARQTDEQQRLLQTGTIAQLLRWMNEPATIREGQDWYRTMLKVGGGAAQPGADLLTAWYKRNFYICANIVQLAKPGGRIAAIYGAGHAHLLRQCASEMPGYKLVEANDYLPK